MRTNEKVIKEISVGNENIPISAKYIGNYEIGDIKDMIDDKLSNAGGTITGEVVFNVAGDETTTYNDPRTYINKDGIIVEYNMNDKRYTTITQNGITTPEITVKIEGDNKYGETNITQEGITSPKFITKNGTAFQLVRGNGSCTVLTKAEVTSALGYTPPTTNADSRYTQFINDANYFDDAGYFIPSETFFTNAIWQDNPAVNEAYLEFESGDNKVLLSNGTEWIRGGIEQSSLRIPYASSSKSGVMSAADKTKLNGIATGANKYTLPNATSSTLGGVKIGSNISVSSGTISLTHSNVTSALGYTPIGPTGNYKVGNLTGNTFIAADSSGCRATVSSDCIDLMDESGVCVEIKSNGIIAPKFITAGGTAFQLVRGNGSCIALTKSEVTTALGYTPPTTSVATTSAAGLMSAADKTKLNSLFPAVEEITYNGSTNGDETLQNILECIGKWAYKNNGACKILVMNPNGKLMYGSFDIFSTWVKRNSSNNDWNADVQIIQFSGFINPHAIDDGPYTCKYGHLYGYIVYGENGLDSYTVQQSGDSDWYYEM